MKLEIISESKFMGLADGKILDWCPSLNLLTVSMNKTSVWVYRLSGERVYSVNNKAPITSISFMKDGAYFCLSGTDGCIKIYDCNNGNLTKVIDKNFANINLISFNYHRISTTSPYQNIFKTDVLSRLPTLSAEGSTGDFSSTSAAQISLSNDISALDLNNLSFLVVIDSTNKLAFNFNNLLTIEGISLPAEGFEITHYFDNNNCFFDQYLLVRNSVGDHELVRMSLKIGNNYHHLTDIILKLCKVAAIINFVGEQLALVNREFSSFFDYFDRQLSNLNDSIELQSNEKICISLYDIILTGMIPESQKDFWLNQLGERGYKRLLSTGTGAYELARNVIFAKVIASLERLVIILSELKSMSEWYEQSGSDIRGCLLSEEVISLISNCNTMIKSLYSCIWDLNKEQEQFVHFLEWIKFEIIDKLAKENDYNTYLAIPQKDIRHTDLIEYVNGSLLRSKSLKYFALDFSRYEVLCKLDEPVHNLESQHLAFIDIFNLALENFKNFMRSNLHFDHLNIKLDCHGELKVKYLQGGTCLISSCDEKTITFFKYEILNNSIVKVVVNLEPDSKVLYEFKDDKEVVVLITHASTLSYQLETFNFLELFKVITPLIHYNSIHKLGSLTEEEIRLKSPKYLAINCKPNELTDTNEIAELSHSDERKTFGCLLDLNRQNYVIFSL